MAHQQQGQSSPSRSNYHERTPISPLFAPQYHSSISGIPSLQSLRNPYQRPQGQDAYDLGNQLVSPIMSRSPSVASDRYSTVSGLTSTYFPSTPHNVHPAASYVAPFGATQVVSEHRAGKERPSSDDEDSPNKDDVQFSAPALALVNAFLDQLLFSFLSTARSTSLSALKPAVIEVLKHRLAREAIASAEEELQELLAGGDEEEEMNTKQNAAENNRKWDLELVWKRTRLRVMVYMRLGEMEDEDEERYVQEEELFQSNERRFSQTSGLVSWAAAIFLTGVLEYVAEQTLQSAGQAAYMRARRQSRSARVTTPEEERRPVTVEDHDVEKVALSSTLGRLWRTWRKTTRNSAAPPTPGQHAAFSRLSHETLGRRSSVGTGAEGSVNGDADRPIRLEDVPEMEYPEHVLASNIPLPIGEQRRDIDEIEVPGLARDPDTDEREEDVRTSIARRNSFTAPTTFRTTGGLPTPDSTTERIAPMERPRLERLRSTSVPTPARTPMAAEGMNHVPGAFLEELEEAEGAGLEENEEVEPKAASKEEAEDKHPAEQKANAGEMAPHKRQSQDVKSLLDKVASNEPPEETAEQKEKSEHHGLVGGAIAGATAAAAAAAAMVYGRKDDHEDKDVDTEDAGEADAEHTQSDAVENVQPTAETRDIEELDKRKSLMDMKDLLSPAQVGEQHATQQSASAPETLPTQARPGSSDSRKSYTLGNSSRQEVPQQSPAKRQHMPASFDFAEQPVEDGIGMARTSDVRVPSPASTPPSEDTQAREPSRRPSRLILGGTPPNVIDGTALKKKESPKSPHEFLASRSLTSKTDRPDFSKPGQPLGNNVEQRRAETVRAPQKRRSIPGVAFTSAAATPTLEPNPHRQSWSAAIEQQRQQRREQHDGEPRPVSVPAVPSVPLAHKSITAESPIQEHPVVQRMASLKRNDRKSDPTAADGEAALTSASIRGPEDFDSFVNGAETVKYTLTPETVRDVPVQQQQPRSPVELSSAPSVSRRRPEAPPAPIDTSDTRTGRSQASKQATSAGAEDETEDERRARYRDNRRSISRPPPRNISAHRRSGLMAREPRVMTESTQDFADFIRSTGPQKEPDVKPILHPANRSTTSLHSLRSAHINGASRSNSVVSQDRTASQDRTRSLTKSVMDADPSIPPIPPMPSKGRSSMRPREASTSGNGNSELIDFIRSGPGQDGQHRISRTVAPFRSTMDSDQLQDIGDRINTDKPLDLRLNTSVGKTPSIPSAGSRTPTAQSSQRLNSNGRAAMGGSNAAQTVHPAHSGQPQRLSAMPGNSAAAAEAAPEGALPSAPGTAPSRRRYRNKDPYAIDMDDEDNDLLTALPKNRRQEESLMDFLNNTEPPKDNAPRPLVDGTPGQARNVMNKARTSSINSLRAAANADAGRTKSMQSTNGPRPGSSSTARTLPRPGSASSSAPRGQLSSTASGPGATSRPKMEARSPGDVSKDKAGARPGTFQKQSNTKDLADFLKNSGPEDDKSAPAPIVGRQSKLSAKDAAKAQKKVEKEAKSGGKRSFFGRAKGKTTWLDMR